MSSWILNTVFIYTNQSSFVYIKKLVEKSTTPSTPVSELTATCLVTRRISVQSDFLPNFNFHGTNADSI